MKKLLVVGVIILFLGVALAPSIHANTQPVLDSELVEITTEVCGIPGMEPQTIQLSKTDAETVDKFFDEIKIKLDNVETREEATEIFNEAIVELDKYGLLGGLSVKQVQKLVIYSYPLTGILKILKRINDRHLGFLNQDKNFFCLVFGETNSNVFFSIPHPLVKNETDQYYILSVYYHLHDIFPFYFPIRIWANVYLGQKIDIYFDTHHYVEYHPTEGHIWTIGLNGIKEWNGSFYGGISTFFHQWWGIGLGGAQYTKCRGMVGFKGIEIRKNKGYLFLGNANRMAISYEYPWD